MDVKHTSGTFSSCKSRALCPFWLSNTGCGPVGTVSHAAFFHGRPLPHLLGTGCGHFRMHSRLLCLFPALSCSPHSKTLISFLFLFLEHVFSTFNWPCLFLCFYRSFIHSTDIYSVSTVGRELFRVLRCSWEQGRCTMVLSACRHDSPATFPPTSHLWSLSALFSHVILANELLPWDFPSM